MTVRPWERAVLAQPETEVLCRSRRFTVVKSFEAVILCGEGRGEPVAIGGFYGDPVAASIDEDEMWCVVVGCGLIAYRLAFPWRPYAYPPVEGGDQWWEFGRSGADVVWFESIVSVGPGEFLAVAERGEATVSCGSRVVGWTDGGA